jgi:hypothetical protein
MAGLEELGGAVSRRQFVLLGGGSAAAIAFLAACGSESSAQESETSQFGDGDAGILNYALTLEHLEAALYTDVVASGLFQGSDLATMRKFGGEEAEHVATLTKEVERLGGHPAAKPKTRFPLADAKSALALAAKIENLGAAAYLGQVANVESTSAMETMLSIHSVEGRHAAAIDALLGKPFAPDGAFAQPASAKAVLASLEPFMAG